MPIRLVTSTTNEGKLYTEKELKEAVQAEREACRMECVKIMKTITEVDRIPYVFECAEAIRKRGK